MTQPHAYPRYYAAGAMGRGFLPGRPAWERVTKSEQKLLRRAHHLESYAYLNDRNMEELERTGAFKIFLDSGAFTAFTQGKPVDIDAYIQFYRRWEHLVEHVEIDGEQIPMMAAVDVIKDAEGTWRNFCEMRDKGVTAIPTYHLGEPEGALEWYLENAPYVAISQANTRKNFAWLDRIWKRYLVNKDGTPKFNIHGFACTDFSVWPRYPWTSVDSVTWLLKGANGLFKCGVMGRDISITEGSAAYKRDMQHFDNLTKAHRKAIRKELKRYGMTEERLRTCAASRCVYTLRQYLIYEEALQRNPPKFVQQQPELI